MDYATGMYYRGRNLTTSMPPVVNTQREIQQSAPKGERLQDYKITRLQDYKTISRKSWSAELAQDNSIRYACNSRYSVHEDEVFIGTQNDSRVVWLCQRALHTLNTG